MVEFHKMTEEKRNTKKEKNKNNKRFPYQQGGKNRCKEKETHS